jgi:hypothetical protein
MHGPWAIAVWLLRYLTGYRLYHLLALIVALAVTLGATAWPFLWLGEQADAFVGPIGLVIVAIVYLYAAMLVLALAAIVVGRLLLGRLRRLFT